MKNTYSRFTGSIPEIYDACLGPLLFEFSAEDLSNRVRRRVPPKSAILEVACGTGISTRHLRNALPETVHILATDLNEPMLAFAKRTHSNLPGVTFEFADALSLPFDNQHFDAVICQFGIMFFPDKAKGLSEMFRVLKPGGIVALNVWDSLEQNKIAAIAHETIATHFEHDPPQFLKTPFGFFDIEQIKDLITQAGFQRIDVHVVSEIVEGIDATQVAKGFVQGNPNIIEITERATVEASVIVKAVANAIESVYGPAPLKIPLQEIVFEAEKP